MRREIGRRCFAGWKDVNFSGQTEIRVVIRINDDPQNRDNYGSGVIEN
ncbi:hypothetical protein M8494_11130 [Serratia ureilytica]